MTHELPDVPRLRRLLTRNPAYIIYGDTMLKISQQDAIRLWRTGRENGHHVYAHVDQFGVQIVVSK